MSEKNNYAIPAVGVLIYNQKNEVLLVKSPKYLDLWTIPGGKIDKGESIEQTAKREIKEETGLEIANLKFISTENSLDYKYFPIDKHFVLLNYVAKESGGKIKKSREVSYYIWIDPKEALKRKDVSDTVVSVLIKFIELTNKEEDHSFKAKYQRALADQQNIIKKNELERDEFIKYALANFIEDLIPIYDHLKLSIKGLPESEKNNAWVVGVNHVLRQFKDLLQSKGVEEIETQNKKFDHNLMEAIEGKGDIVITEVSPGYKLNGRLLKPAKVIVGEKK